MRAKGALGERERSERCEGREMFNWDFEGWINSEGAESGLTYLLDSFWGLGGVNVRSVKGKG